MSARGLAGGLLAMAIALGAIAASLARLRRVERAISADPEALARALRSGARGALAAWAEAARSEGALWEAELLAIVATARGERARVALVNEHLSDLRQELEWGARIPLTAGRISLTGPFCILFVELAWGGELPWGSLLTIVAWGVAGFFTSLTVGKEATRHAQRLRAGIDRLVTQVLAMKEASADQQ